MQGWHACMTDASRQRQYNARARSTKPQRREKASGTFDDLERRRRGTRYLQFGMNDAAERRRMEEFAEDHPDQAPIGHVPIDLDPLGRSAAVLVEAMPSYHPNGCVVHAYESVVLALDSGTLELTLRGRRPTAPRPSLRRSGFTSRCARRRTSIGTCRRTNPPRRCTDHRVDVRTRRVAGRYGGGAGGGASHRARRLSERPRRAGARAENAAPRNGGYACLAADSDESDQCLICQDAARTYFRALRPPCYAACADEPIINTREGQHPRCPYCRDDCVFVVQLRKP